MTLESHILVLVSQMATSFPSVRVSSHIRNISFVVYQVVAGCTQKIPISCFSPSKNLLLTKVSNFWLIAFPTGRQKCTDFALERSGVCFYSEPPSSLTKNRNITKYGWIAKLINQTVLNLIVRSNGRFRVRSVVPQDLCSPVPMFPRSYVPLKENIENSYLCSPGPMFPTTYISQMLS